MELSDPRASPAKNAGEKALLVSAAMRQGSSVYYLYGDHLGSTSLITNASGATLTETRYEPYGQPSGEGRPTGSGAPRDILLVQADYGFTPSGKSTLRVQTGQRLDGFGLMDYNARYYSRSFL